MGLFRSAGSDRSRRFGFFAIALVGMSFIVAADLSAQFTEFGKNKVQYSEFDWRILAGKHIDLYYYPEEEEIAYPVSYTHLTLPTN